jgi:uncharacterized circularly permuted ATP-grasp superfamily protein
MEVEKTPSQSGSRSCIAVQAMRSFTLGSSLLPAFLTVICHAQAKPVISVLAPGNADSATYKNEAIVWEQRSRR